jgi:pimeloyl-ACP methyl ester carboxylesterase
MALLVLYYNASAGEYVRVSPDLELYYVEAGTGTPLIFIPGWCGTTEFFMQYQIPHFSKNHRVLSFDPRSHGRSSKTLENNNYIQHGKDLRAFMQALELKDVILAGWSAGSTAIYAYLRMFGTDNVKACIFIDQTPKSWMTQEGDWGWLAEISEARDFINGTVYDQRGFTTAFFPTLMKREMTQDELDWAVDQALKTPTFVAALLVTDELFGDYTQEARAIDGKIPVLNILNEDWAEAAQKWLAENAPASETFVLGKHAMLWEFPNEFNAALDAFLSKIK